MAKRAIFQGPVEIGETPVYAEGTSAVALVPGYVVTRSGKPWRCLTLPLPMPPRRWLLLSVVLVSRVTLPLRGLSVTPFAPSRFAPASSSTWRVRQLRLWQRVISSPPRLPLAACWRRALLALTFRCSSWKRLLPPLPLVSSFWLIRHKEKLCP